MIFNHLNKENNKKVNLFIIGVNKAGTSWLHFLLEKHPDIYMSKLKEHYYFGREYPNQLEEYHSYFPFEKPYTYFGESTHLYNQSKEAAEQIKKYCPEAKLFAIVRDPIERLISQYYFQKQTGVISEKTTLEEILFDPTTPLIIESHYERSMPMYRELFDENQFKILSLEECNKDHDTSWQSIQEFLKLDTIPLPPAPDSKENATGGKLFRSLYRATIKPIKTNFPNLYGKLMQNEFVHWTKNQLLNILGTAKKDTLSTELIEKLKKEFAPTYAYLAELGYGKAYNRND